MKPSTHYGRYAGLALVLIVLGLIAGCSTSGTPSVAAPPSTVTATVTSTTTARTTSTVTVTATPTPTPTPTPSTRVTATFKDNTTFECNDASADSCWELDVTTTGPCPNGVYVAINVYKQGATDVLQVLNTTSQPVTEPQGGTVTVQLSQTGLAPGGETLEADLSEARCA